jgi:hypothetical protein
VIPRCVRSATRKRSILPSVWPNLHQRTIFSHSPSAGLFVRDASASCLAAVLPAASLRIPVSFTVPPEHPCSCARYIVARRVRSFATVLLTCTRPAAASHTRVAGRDSDSPCGTGARSLRFRHFLVASSTTLAVAPSRPALGHRFLPCAQQRLLEPRYLVAPDCHSQPSPSP